MNDVADKVNQLAEQHRRLSQILGTDYLSRQSVPGPGHLPVGSGSRAMDLLPPDQPDGFVLTLDSRSPLGMRWGASGGTEVDSDANGNVWEGPGALAGNPGFSSFANNTAIGFHALADYSTPVGFVGGNVAIGWNANEESWQPCTISGNAPPVFQGSVAIGDRCGALSDSIAIGREAAAGSDLSAVNTQAQAIAIGVQAVAFHEAAIAIGHLASAWDGTFVDNNVAAMIAIGNNSAATASFSLAIGSDTGASAPGSVAIGCDHTNTGASSNVADLIVLGTLRHTTRIPGIPAFVAGDKYLVVDASGDIHKSALGPAS